MPKVADRVEESTTSTGTGSITLGGAATGRRTFSAAFTAGDSVYYSIDAGAEWEVGVGTYTSGTLSRDTVLASSAAGAKVNFSAGAKRVFVTAPAVLVSGGVRDTNFAAAIPFRGKEQMALTQVSGALAFSVDTTGAFDGAECTVHLLADGTNAPTFNSPLREWIGSAGYDNRNGIRNVISFWRSGGAYWYSIGQAVGATAELLPATALTFTGPSSGATGAASTNFTVVANGSLASSVTVSLSDGGAGGSFTPSSLTLTSGSTSATFTYTAASAGAKTLSITNNGGLTNPSSLTYTASAATVPGAPTIGTATAGDAQATVSFTAPGSNGGSAILDYTVTSSPGGFTATGASSPLTVTGLSNGTAYTFTVTARNAIGSGSASAASNSVTPAASVNYSFESDTVGSAAANTTAVNGSWVVANPTISGATYGKSLRCASASGNGCVTLSSASSAALGNNQRATWRRGATTTGQSKDGVLLRAQAANAGGAYAEIKQGYWFYVNGSGNTLSIYKMTSGGPVSIASGTFTDAADQWFRATITGSTLTFDVSPDGSSWTNKVTLNSETTFTTAAAACQYANDGGSASISSVYLDQITFVGL